MGSEFDGGESDESATARRRRLDRERQNEVLGALDISRGRLTHARFVGAQTSFAQNKSGDVVLTIIVPFEYRDQAIPMLDASGIPLSFDVVPWRRGVEHWPENGET